MSLNTLKTKRQMDIKKIESSLFSGAHHFFIVRRFE